MIKAVFLDRDGVINDNEVPYYITKPEEFVLNKGIIEALKALLDNDFQLIIISNQSGISKKIYSREDCDRVHEKLIDMMSGYGIAFEEIYYCPHHPEFENCLCRKPQPLMFEKAIARFDIDPEKSWMIGDSEKDIIGAKNAGLKSILISSNEDIRKYINRIIKTV
jgi:D-glycero-D-manno-heptose 1,7-bisphosphate phosphatase